MKRMKKLSKERMRKVNGGAGFAPLYFSLAAPRLPRTGGPDDFQQAKIYY